MASCIILNQVGHSIRQLKLLDQPVQGEGKRKLGFLDDVKENLNHIVVRTWKRKACDRKDFPMQTWVHNVAEPPES